MNASGCDWKAAMRNATSEQWAELALLVAAKVCPDATFRQFARGWIEGDRDAARSFAARHVPGWQSAVFRASAAVRGPGLVANFALAAAGEAYKASQEADSVADGDWSGHDHAGIPMCVYREHNVSRVLTAAWFAADEALRAGLGEADLAATIDAVLGGETGRLLDALGIDDGPLEWEERFSTSDPDPMRAALRIWEERGLEETHQVDSNRGWHVCQRTGVAIGPSATIRPREGRGVRITVISDRTRGEDQ